MLYICSSKTARFSSAQAELSRQVGGQKLSQPNQVSNLLCHPVQLTRAADAVALRAGARGGAGPVGALGLGVARPVLPRADARVVGERDNLKEVY